MYKIIKINQIQLICMEVTTSYITYNFPKNRRKTQLNQKLKFKKQIDISTIVKRNILFHL